jgi:hypothetical protein
MQTIQRLQNVFIAAAAKCQQRGGSGSGSGWLGLGLARARVGSPYLWAVLTMAWPTRACHRATGSNRPTMPHRVPICKAAQYWARSLPVRSIWSTFREPSAAVAPMVCPIAPKTLDYSRFAWPVTHCGWHRPAPYSLRSGCPMGDRPGRLAHR